ncbi:MAG: response regulator transcription factor [Candidatus Acidiferrum sp.]
MKVLIADDHEIVRRGVKSILLSKENTEVCAEATNGQEALQKAAECKPDLIILDHSMPVLDGLSAASRIREIMPNVPILMLSMHDGPPLIDALRLVGAQGFVPKAECAERLMEGVDAVMRGETFFITEGSGRGRLLQ